MDHDVVARQKMTERYLLGELNPDLREEFEEHFFDCPECAMDVRAGALFVEQSKAVLAEESHAVSGGVPAAAHVVPPRPGWLAGLRSAWRATMRPAFAVPVMALLLAVIGYQNLVTTPQLRHALNHPRVLPFAAVNVGSMGSGEAVVSIAPGEGFLLLVRIPPDGYACHTAELYNPARNLEWSLPIPSSAPDTSPAQDQFPVQVPGAQLEAGTYTLVVRGTSAAGDSKEVRQASFELQIQK
jgi:hypothetical protein